MKKVAGTPNFAKTPAGSEVLFDGTTASAKANWVAEKPKLFQGLRATAHSVGSPPCVPAVLDAFLTVWHSYTND